MSFKMLINVKTQFGIHQNEFSKSKKILLVQMV